MTNELLEQVRGNREVLTTRVASSEAGYQVDNNEGCARRAANGAALQFLGAEKLVDLVGECLRNQGGLSVDTGMLTQETMQAVCEQLEYLLTHPEVEGITPA